MTAKERIEAIRTYDDLQEFVWWLVQEHEDNPEWWQNRDLNSFLVALASWNMRGYYLNAGEEFPEHPSWKAFANMLMGATMYGV